MKVDLDGDGLAEFVILDQRGAPRVYRERFPDDRPRRCSVDPRPRFAPTTGTGYAFRPEGSEVYRTWDIQGHMRFGAPSRLLLPHRAGILRFPSGAELPWSCDVDSHVTTVTEPEWVQLDLDFGRVRLRANAPWLFDGSDEVAVDVAWLDAGDDPSALPLRRLDTFTLTEDELQAGLALSPPDDATRLLVRFETRWLPQTFRIR